MPGINIIMKLLLILLLPIAMRAQSFVESNPGSAKAHAFVNSLSTIQQKKAVFAFEEMSRYDWHYLPATMAIRNGIGIRELDSSQKYKLYSLMKAYLSNEGYTRTKNIMSFENLLKEIIY